MRLIDLTGQRFGRLLVLDRAPSASGETRWSCLCDCGAAKVAFAQNLRRGLSTSCGCLRSAQHSARFTEDLTGRRFGCLVPTRRGPDYVAPSGARHVRWECVCDCGRTAVAGASDLRSGHTTTCGCRRYERLIDADHVLYRQYDAAGDLLYIGITNEWDRRAGEHGRLSPWWSEVARVTHESFPDRASAMQAEKAAIRSEDPVFNRARYLGG